MLSSVTTQVITGSIHLTLQAIGNIWINSKGMGGDCAGGIGGNYQPFLENVR